MPSARASRRQESSGGTIAFGESPRCSVETRCFVEKEQALLKLDHLTVIAPTLAEGVAHVRACLDLDVPFGQRHDYMGTHNHLLQLGGEVYLEIVALDPDGRAPGRSRWFGLDDQKNLRAAWDDGRRLRGWVARTDGIDSILAGREAVFGRKVSLPFVNPAFDFAIPDDGSLPLGGALPSLIDRRGKPRSMATMADLGARLKIPHARASRAGCHLAALPGADH